MDDDAHTAGMPRRLLTIGYNTIDEFTEKGVLRRGQPDSIELHYNFERMFEEVLYIVPFGRNDIDERLTETVRYRERKLSRGRGGLGLVVRALAQVPQAVRMLDAAVRQFKPDVVQICGPHIPAVLFLLSKEARRLPSVCMIEAFWETILPHQEYMPAALRLVLPAWYRWLYRRFDRYTGAPSVAPTFYTKRGMDPARIADWLQPVDIRAIADADPARAPESVAAAAAPRIAVIGRLHSEKLAGDALEIFAKAVGADHPGSLIFVGDGDERAAIETRARDLGLSGRVVITGLLPHAEVFSVMKLCDCSIAPMQGSALLESMASGLAIVAYDHETHRALIQDGRTGVLVPHRDVAAAAAVLSGWLEDGGSAAKPFAESARRWAEEQLDVANVRRILYSGFAEAAASRDANGLEAASLK